MTTKLKGPCVTGISYSKILAGSFIKIYVCVLLEPLPSFMFI